MRRRTVVTGFAGLAATAALPALAQGIGRQTDPYAQIDPYADPRNGGGLAPSRNPAPPSPAGRHGPIGSGAISPEEEEEIAIGRSVYPRWIQESGGPYPDARLQQALKDFCKPIFAAANRSHLPWVVTLTNAPFPNVNASAGHGGHVIVHTAMIQVLDRPEYLVAILGHEVGHVDLHHGVRGSQLRMMLENLRERGISPLDNGTLGTLLPETRGAVRDYLELVEMAFSRDDEADADAHSLVILERLGIDPRFAAEAERTFLKLEEMMGSAPSEWVTDHPLTPDRVRAMKEGAALLSRPKSRIQFAGWDILKAAFPTLPPFKKA